eukprot:scaffold55582_cov58-Phaeocystis_antarctica.AAC.6
MRAPRPTIGACRATSRGRSWTGGGGDELVWFRVLLLFRHFRPRRSVSSSSLKLGEAVRQPEALGLSVPLPCSWGAPRMCEPCTPETLLEAVRGLRVADPNLGFKPLLAKLRAQQLDLGAATKEVRVALTALKAENEAAETAAIAPPAADEGGAPSNVALSLACIGCARLPSDMDDEREKHPICDKCRDEKLPTTYLCGVNCPANLGAWELHGAFHKKVRKQQKAWEDGGVLQQRNREVAEDEARAAAQSGDKYDELLAEGLQYRSNKDLRKAGKAYREAIALEPDEPYFNLGNALTCSGHDVEAAQRYLEAKERYSVGSELWANATALAFDKLRLEACDEVAKPEWWNDEGLKALSARVVRAAPNDEGADHMRALVLCGGDGAFEAGPRSAAELKEAAAHFDRAVALCPAPAVKTGLTEIRVGRLLPQPGRGRRLDVQDKTYLFRRSWLVSLFSKIR